MAYSIYSALDLAFDFSTVSPKVIPQVPRAQLTAIINGSNVLSADADFYTDVHVGETLAIEDEQVTVASKGTSPALNVTRGVNSTTPVDHQAGTWVHSTDLPSYREGRIFISALRKVGRDRPKFSAVRHDSSGTAYYLLTDIIPAWSEDTHSIVRIRLATEQSAGNWFDRNGWMEDIGTDGNGNVIPILRFTGGDPGDTFEIYYGGPWLETVTTFDLPTHLFPLLTARAAADLALAAAGHHADKSEVKLRGADSVAYGSISGRFLKVAEKHEKEYVRLLQGQARNRATKVDLDTGYGGTGRSAAGRVILRRRRF